MVTSQSPEVMDCMLSLLLLGWSTGQDVGELASPTHASFLTLHREEVPSAPSPLIEPVHEASALSPPLHVSNTGTGRVCVRGECRL